MRRSICFIALSGTPLAHHMEQKQSASIPNVMKSGHWMAAKKRSVMWVNNGEISKHMLKPSPHLEKVVVVIWLVGCNWRYPRHATETSESRHSRYFCRELDVDPQNCRILGSAKVEDAVFLKTRKSLKNFICLLNEQMNINIIRFIRIIWISSVAAKGSIAA